MNTEFDHGATSLKVDGKVSIEKVMEQGKWEQSNPEFLSELGETIDTSIYKSQQLKMQINHFNRNHPLNFHEVLEEDENPGCQACKLEILTQAYICKKCEYYLHKACTDLHPEFKVDVKCAGMSAPRNQGQRLKEMYRKTKISHFSHEHMLVLGNAKKHYYCSYCQLEIFGLAYCCLDCIYVLHVSCLGFPEEMQHPFHPLHLLVANMADYCVVCNACDIRILGINYSCFECGLEVEEVLSWLVPRIRKKSVELE
ncbi:Cysteine/Histidine-rich C1 domain family protein, putative [Theobroma cacao]|uniref:Cysteine/Histidine-rich C1 domain family protein, putative n=1 Tax=Theobroma cacao TaxID=3641 RepID=A0A061F2C4_THECC|nr:Cysteine/Histidine-rich C1 domain family protein, putative [Theobroma cacao]